MPAPSRYSALFEPLQIGPVTAPNRFYQVPHCTGMGFATPETLIAMRETKAEGGWGVVCTEYCSIDRTSDDSPYQYAALWDARDVRDLGRMADAVHKHGALAGVELWQGGFMTANLHSRATPIGPVSQMAYRAPVQSMRMDLADIRAYRKSHRDAALRAREAGFDIVYVYAAHGYLNWQFLNAACNDRDDAYGGSLENRARILTELLEETKDAIGDRCAVALRIEVDDDFGTVLEPGSERRELFERIRHLPDLFDLTVQDYTHEMGTSRFHAEGSLEPLIAGVRGIVGKPVVSVGRFTSPDTMLRMVKSGVVDLVGAARPSIADPFLPRKIREDRADDIRECIGCNICYASNSQSVPLRCTQNPTMGEEWRRGWHPERVPQAEAPSRILIVGGGPAGLEAALTLGRAGHEVLLAEASRDLGGRVLREAALPGLREWIRVRDYREYQLSKLTNVEVYRESRVGPQDIDGLGAAHVLLATGSRWRTNGLGRHQFTPVASFADPRTLSPDAVMSGERPAGPVVVFDDEGYVIASAIAALLATEGFDVTFVCTGGIVAPWTTFTAEQPAIQKRLLESGARVLTGHQVTALAPDMAEATCVYTGRKTLLPCGGFIPVTSREPDDMLWRTLSGRDATTGPSFHRLGDCKAPGLIATAIHDAHRTARELSGTPPARRERT